MKGPTHHKIIFTGLFCTGPKQIYPGFYHIHCSKLLLISDNFPQLPTAIINHHSSLLGFATTLPIYPYIITSNSILVYSHHMLDMLDNIIPNFITSMAKHPLPPKLIIFDPALVNSRVTQVWPRNASEKLTSVCSSMCYNERISNFQMFQIWTLIIKVVFKGHPNTPLIRSFNKMHYYH